MKKLLFLAALLGATATAHAQTKATVGLTAAYGYTELSHSGSDYHPVGHSAYQAGITGDVYLADVFSIHPELLYTLQFYDTNEVSMKQNRDVTYLTLPVLARYHVGGSDGGLFFEAGPQLNLPLKAVDDFDNDVKSQVNSLSLDYIVGLGYQLRQGLSLGVRYDGGITNVFKDYASTQTSPTPTADDKIVSTSNLKNSTFWFSLGYSFGGVK